MNFKQITLIGLLSIFSFSTLNAQDDSEVSPDEISKWKLESKYALNLTQSTFTNWASGGRNNISGLGFINAFAEYKSGRIRWASTLSTGLGGVQYFDEEIEKTDDVLDLQSTISYGLKDPWFISLLGGFRTQYLNGYASPEDSLRSSTFMAPGYVNISLGIEYIPNDNLKLLLSPLSGKFTFVQDQVLANAGAFGVEPAEYNSLGDLVNPGENFRAELGAYFRVIYKKQLMENIGMRSRLEFFSNYMENPQNLDVNGELILDFKVNEWFSANLQLNMIYDDDIDIEDRNGNVGPRTQFKQVIGLGIAYRMANFKEEK
ncbi:DUF3078 domain-containing protein [Brumimicrobium aurantiacum]|uniref:DUF3078 domain-containing protein n=1 Tax=Brumimicrobium aurantiacum TaxID=1737063 RepID=A0A3E1EWP9_9FLAO|nr:DUF3078 domain-containing protein [Brumimicrobium aurantiacum]RFC53948.1 DUF3078 domain-containing protein [Brumimicrobium aurantiacum]